MESSKAVPKNVTTEIQRMVMVAAVNAKKKKVEDVS
jgi:hypothetical protein